MSFKLTILGSSSAIPTEKNRPTAQLLNINERFFLIDCGEGTQVQLRKYKINSLRINYIFISHLHGDHYFGLIGLISSMHLLGRTKELHIYGHQKLKEILDIQLAAAEIELNYPLFFHSISEIKEDILFDDNDVLIENILLDHKIACSGFIFTEKKSKRRIDRKMIDKLNIPYNKINSIKDGADWINQNGQIIRNQDLTVENSLPYTYAFCTDTRYDKNLISKVKEVDLLYHETTFKKDEVRIAARTGHSTTFEASEIAREARVKNLMIGHFSRRYNNIEELLIEVKDNFPNAIIAEPGLTVDFKLLRKVIF